MSKFFVIRTYPKYAKIVKDIPEANMDGLNDLMVNLEISTFKKLPEEFFTDLANLLDKHTKE